MICLERSVIHVIHWIICYHRNVFLLIYEHALVILFSYPSTLHCCIKSHLLWESYISMFYLLATDLLLLRVIVISFINVAVVCASVTWIKDYLLTYLLISSLKSDGVTCSGKLFQTRGAAPGNDRIYANSGQPRWLYHQCRRLGGLAMGHNHTMPSVHGPVALG